MDTKTFKYIPQEHSREKNTYVEEYYSSPDVTIIIDGKEFNEANSINFSVQEQLKPIYGYNSSTYDDVAVGNRIVVGSITVPIKNNTSNEKIVDEYTEVEIEDDISQRPGWANNYYGGNSSYHIESNNSTNNSNGSEHGIINVNNNVVSSIRVPLGFSEEIKNAQEMLLNQNYDVSVNGYLDLRTRRALMRYQELNNLTITGLLDEETKNLIFNRIDNGTAEILIPCYIYAGPDSSFEPLGLANRGDRLIIVSELENYKYVKTLGANVMLGYVENMYIKMLQ